MFTRIQNHNARQATQYGVDARLCWRLMKKAKRAKEDGKPTPKRFGKLVKLAAQLADLLKPFAPPDNAPPAPEPLAVAAGQGSTNKPRGAVEAGAMEGKDIADGTGQLGSPDGNGGCGYCYDQRAFRLLYPAVERIAQRIATDGDGTTLLDGLATGPSLGQVHRLMTDGQCLARWQTNEHADGIAASVLLDCSGSMGNQLSDCAGIARAFALAMRDCGQVQTLAFGTRCEESDDYAEVEELGGTNTGRAVSKAVAWLKDKPGSRWIVCITDGQACDDVAAACEEANAQGIRILGIGLDCKIEMPHTLAVTAKDPAHLAIELEAAARLIERV